MSQSSAAAESPSAAAAASDGGGEFMLFGFRVVVDSIRKCVSLNNLSDYQQSNTDNNVNKDDVVVAAAGGSGGGYASADDAVPQANASRERKRGIPWTEEEHKLFLLGLKKVGKGDWRGISKNYVKTRTPTQVASHAQKYFLRRNNHSRRRRRSSLFDITTESLAATSEKEEHDVSQENISLTQPFQPQLEAFNFGGFQGMTPYPVTATAALPVPVENPMRRLKQGYAHGLHSIVSNKMVRPTPVHQTPEDSVKSDLNLNLNLAMDPPELSLHLSSPSNYSAFQAMSNLNNGENIVSVA